MIGFFILTLAIAVNGSGGKLDKDEILVCSTDPKGRPLQDFQLPPGYSEDLPAPYGLSKKGPPRSFNRPSKGSRADVLYVVPGSAPPPLRTTNSKSAKHYRPYYDEHIAEFIKEQPGQNAHPVHGEYLAEMMYEHSKSAEPAKSSRQPKPDLESKYMTPYQDVKYIKNSPGDAKLQPCDPKVDPFCDKYDSNIFEPKDISKLYPAYDPKMFSKINPYSKYEPIKKSDKFYTDFKNIESFDDPKNLKNDPFDFKNYEQVKSVKYDPIFDSKSSKFDFDSIKEIKNSDVKGSKFEQIYDSKNFDPIYDSKNSKYQYEPLTEFKNGDVKGNKYEPIYDSKNFDSVYESKNSKYQYEPLTEFKNDEIKGNNYEPNYDSKSSKFEYEPIRELKNDDIKGNKFEEIYDSKNYEPFREYKNDEPKGFKNDPIYDSKISKFEYEPIKEFKNDNSKYSKFEPSYESTNSKPENYDILEDKNMPTFYDTKKHESFEPIREYKSDSVYERSKFEEKYPTFSNRRRETESFEEDNRNKSFEKSVPTFKKNGPRKEGLRRGSDSVYYMEESKENRGVTKKPCLPPPCPEEDYESCGCE